MTNFNIGDRVRVNFSNFWDGDGTVTRITKPGKEMLYHVLVDGKKFEGGFYGRRLTLITSKSSAYFAGAEAARKIALAKGTVTADDVQSELIRQGFSSNQLGNAAGAIFRSSIFRKIGTIRSNRPTSRGRMIAQWALVR